MELKERLQNLFKRKSSPKEKEKTTTITRYDTSQVDIPKYSDLSKPDKKQVDGYIKEIDIENLGDLILYANEMSKNASANTELLLRLFFKTNQIPADYVLDDMKQEEIATRRLDAIIDNEQLQLYKDDMLSLEKESTLRAVALERMLTIERIRKLDFLGIFGIAERMKRNNQLDRLNAAVERMKVSKQSIGYQIEATEREIQAKQVEKTTADVYNAITQPDENLAKQVLMRKVRQTLKMIGKFKKQVDNYLLLCYHISNVEMHIKILC